MIVNSLDATMYPPNGAVMIPSSLVSYMGSNVNPLLGNVFWITLILSIIYSAFVFRQKIMLVLS
jgi:hypothetical protein